MDNTFVYLILQYCHSVLTREAINVGVLFKFSDEDKIRIYIKEDHKLALVYREFDQTNYDLALAHISKGIADYNLDTKEPDLKIGKNFTEVVRNRLKWQDSILQFSDPFISVTIDDNDATMAGYIKMLLHN